MGFSGYGAAWAVLFDATSAHRIFNGQFFNGQLPPHAGRFNLQPLRAPREEKFQIEQIL
jgi:hypothetical protein